MKVNFSLWIVLCVSAVVCEVKIVKKIEKTSGADTDVDEEEDVDTPSPLLHELITGPVIDKEPHDIEVPFQGIWNSSSLQCSTSHALSVYFICSSFDPSANSGQTKEKTNLIPSMTVDLVDPMTGVRHIEIEATLNRTVFERFSINQTTPDNLYCVCHAWSSKGNATSRVVRVKSVVGSPVVEQKSSKDVQLKRIVNLGDKLHLECSLVKNEIQGRRLDKDAISDEVKWFFEGQPLMWDENMEVDHGNLVILGMTLENEGSYNCGFTSSEQRSPPIIVEVKAHGDWSPWGAWSDCFSRCGKGSRTRTRSCTNPPPRHGGKECQGDYIQKEECTSWKDCGSKEKDDTDSAVWSSWTSWSECGIDCKHHRQRWCTYVSSKAKSRSPNPVCSGRSHMYKNCTGGLCQIIYSHPAMKPGLHSVSPNNFLQDPTTASGSEQGFLFSHVGVLEAIAMIVGMALAAIMLAFTFLIAVRFWPKDSSADKRHHIYPTMNGLGTLPSDVTDPRLHEYLTERKLDTGVTIPLLQQLYTPNICNIPMTPSQVRANHYSNTQRSRTPSSTDKTRTDSESQHYSDYGPPGSASEYDMIYDTIPDELKPEYSSSTQVDSIAWVTVGTEGGRICLEHFGIAMLIPPGALRHTREMYITVLNQDKDKPNLLREDQSILSPVIQCGPGDIHLGKPIVLSFDHCATPPSEKWNIHLLSGDPDSSVCNWNKELSLTTDSDDCNSNIFCQIDNGMCHVQTNKLGKFVLVGESRSQSFAAKSVALLPYLSKVSSVSPNDYSVKIYCVENTKAALQNVYQAERSKSIMLDECKSILLHDGGANLCLALESDTLLSNGWKIKPGANQQEIPFKHVWSSRLSAVHCSFVVTATAPDCTLVCSVIVYQRGNQSHRQILNLNSAAVYRNIKISPNTGLITTGGRGTSIAEGFRLSLEARNRICALLDPQREDGNDWRRLASQLRIDRNMNYFAGMSSPTSCLLDIWEARHREVGAPSTLLNLLRHTGRADVIAATEKLVGAWV